MTLVLTRSVAGGKEAAPWAAASFENAFTYACGETKGQIRTLPVSIS